MYLTAGVGWGQLASASTATIRSSAVWRSSARSRSLSGLVSGNISESVKLSEPISMALRIGLAGTVQVMESLYARGNPGPAAGKQTGAPQRT